MLKNFLHYVDYKTINNLITYESPNKNGDFLFIPIC